ncbi:MAG: XRE family transcriptional regulator [Gemmatimonadales bacterium]|nr:MAG: XRE family transcriptional regulator [Gemmatimonadales bacterium]
MEKTWQDHLRSAIAASRMTNRAVAQRARINSNTFTNWLQSEPKGEPPISAAIRIADALGMTLDEVFRGIELEESARIDALLQAYFHARGIVAHPPRPADPTSGSA